MNYFKSEDVKIFPCTYRGNAETKDVANGAEGSEQVKIFKAFDPEANLMSEYNYTNLPGIVNGLDSYVINYDTTGKLLKCVIGGYYFEIKLAAYIGANDGTTWLKSKKLAVCVRNVPITTNAARTMQYLCAFEDSNLNTAGATGDATCIDRPIATDDYRCCCLTYYDLATPVPENTNKKVIELDLSKSQNWLNNHMLLSVSSNGGLQLGDSTKPNTISSSATAANAMAFAPGSEVTASFGCALGKGIKITTANQTAVGSYNAAATNALFVVGAGSSDTTRSNVAEVYSDKIKFAKQVNLSEGGKSTGTLSIGDTITLNPSGSMTCDTLTSSNVTSTNITAGNINASGDISTNGALSANSLKIGESTLTAVNGVVSVGNSISLYKAVGTITASNFTCYNEISAKVINCDGNISSGGEIQCNRLTADSIASQNMSGYLDGIAKYVDDAELAYSKSTRKLIAGKSGSSFVTLPVASTRDYGFVKVGEVSTSSVYTASNSNWPVKLDKNGVAYVTASANISGTIDNAKYLVNSAGTKYAVGGTTKPVYFSNGIPTACNYSFNQDLNTTSSPTFALITCKGQINAKTFNATSDARLKTNIRPYTMSASILDLPIYRYDFLDGEKNKIGCLAQDLQQICPELVHEAEDGYLCIEESKLVYLLLQEVKKLKEQIDN